MRTFANAINSDFINTRMGQDLMINNLCALLHIVKVSFLHVRWMNSALHYVVCNPDDPENARPYSQKKPEYQVQYKWLVMISN